MTMPEFSGFQIRSSNPYVCALGFPPHILSYLDHAQLLCWVNSATGTIAAGFLGLCRTEECGERAGAQCLLSSVQPNSGTEPVSGVAAGCTRFMFSFEKCSLISSGNFALLIVSLCAMIPGDSRLNAVGRPF